MRLPRSKRAPQGRPKGAPRGPKETPESTKTERNDPKGAKRAPRRNPKVKSQYYLVNNTIQEAKLQYYLVNNTIQKSVFYGFSWKSQYYAVNNTIQQTPKAANEPKKDTNLTPCTCKPGLAWDRKAHGDFCKWVANGQAREKTGRGKKRKDETGYQKKKQRK